MTLEYNVTYKEPAPPEMGLIQGKTPGSKEEWWVALALWKLELPFAFQVPIMGGRDRKGGFVVDFVVYAPTATAVEVFGEYWHTGQLGAGDNLRLAMYRKYFGKETVILYASDLRDEQAALNAVREKLA